MTDKPNPTTVVFVSTGNIDNTLYVTREGLRDANLTFEQFVDIVHDWWDVMFPPEPSTESSDSTH